MNNLPVHEQNKPTTSSIKSNVIAWHYIPTVRFPCLQTVVGSTVTTVNIIEPNICFATTPNLEINGVFEAAVIAAQTQIKYNNRASIEALLGEDGKIVLRKLIDLIKRNFHKYEWPLNQVEISFKEDSEVEKWQYILMVLIFDSNFETADKYLQDFYKELDMFGSTLDSEEQGILRRNIYFDVAANF